MTNKEKAILQLYKNSSSTITERTQEIHRLVKGRGSVDSKVVFISYMPTDVEEEEALTFFGDIGEQFNRVLRSIGLTIDDIYVTQLIKYKPYKINERTGRIVKRAVTDDEQAFFKEHLLKELGIIAPEFVVPLGEDVLKILMEDEHISLEQTRGKLLTKSYGLSKYKLIPMDHPVNKTGSIEKDIEVIKTLWEHVNKKTLEDVPKERYTITPKRREMKKKVEMEAPIQDNRMKVIVVYGGTGLTNDPTMEVIRRISHVLTELNTNIIRMDLTRHYDIHEFLEHMETADGVVLSTTVTWLGIGGPLQTFLDACYNFGRQSLFQRCYLMGVVIATQMFERDAYNHLIKSWELLGGMEGTQVCSAIKNLVAFETDKDLGISVDKKAEEFYRIIHQKRKVLPSSIRENKIIIEIEKPVETVDSNEETLPKQKERSTLIPNYDAYIAKQKKDIEDISQLFRKKLNHQEEEAMNHEPKRFMNTYNGKADFDASIQWFVEDQPNKHFIMTFDGGKLSCVYGESDNNHVFIHVDYDILRKILQGKLTIQRAFMTGKLKAQGDFTLLNQLDQAFDLDEA